MHSRCISSQERAVIKHKHVNRKDRIIWSEVKKAFDTNQYPPGFGGRKYSIRVRKPLQSHVLQCQEHIICVPTTQQKKSSTVTPLSTLKQSLESFFCQITRKHIISLFYFCHLYLVISRSYIHQSFPLNVDTVLPVI